MSTIERYTLIAALLFPVLLPLFLLGLALFRSGRRHARASVWCYITALVWAGSGAAFQSLTKVESGYVYGFVLLTGWPIVLAGMLVDPLFQRGKNVNPHKQRANPAVAPAPFGRWTLRDKAAQRRSP
ncbi:MAG: hypothetical protein Q8K23_12405 [Sulfuritalea sp.]|nr:hypothetical protein [Sulfuritalea sp.]